MRKSNPRAMGSALEFPQRIARIDVQQYQCCQDEQLRCVKSVVAQGQGYVLSAWGGVCQRTWTGLFSTRFTSLELSRCHTQ